MRRVIHRGNTGEFPENSVETLERSAVAEAEAVEIDVCLTADDIPVVFHDYHLDKLTNGSGPLMQKRIADLKKLTISVAGIEREGSIPSLQEALEILRGKKKVVLELKSRRGIDLVQNTIEIVQGMEMEEVVTLTSFKPRMLWKAKRSSPKIRTGFTFQTPAGKLVPRILGNRNGGFNELHCKINRLNRRFVLAAHKRGFKVLGWTANSVSEIEHCISCGIDGIFTDKIDLLNEVLGSGS